MTLPLSRFVDRDDPILSEPMPLYEGKAQDLRPLAIKLFRCMKEGNKGIAGVGLSAPQIGERVNLFVVDVNLSNQNFDNALVCINATVEGIGPPDIYLESCLSDTNYRRKVVRSKSIILTYQDIKGKTRIKEIHNFFARVIQHEADHMAGRCIFHEQEKAA